MREDLTVFWQNNARAYELFQDLLSRAERNAYDDDFLVQLAAYREESPESERADIFAAQYLLYHGDAEGAAVCGERAYARSPVNHAVWEVLSRAYMALGRYADALVMQWYLRNAFGIAIALELPPEVLTAHTLDRLSIAMNEATYAPFISHRMSYDPAHGTSEVETAFAGEFLPVSPSITPSYYVGVYTEQEMHGNKAWLLATIRNQKNFVPYVGGDFTFDIIRAQRVQETMEVDLLPGQEIVLPLLTIHRGQELYVHTDTTDDRIWTNPATPNFFRLTEHAVFSSKEGFLVGTPIRIGHSPKRRRLVLNILVDALCWSTLRGCFEKVMPHAHRFFQQGIIFDQHFSIAEYTYPSLAVIETGMYPHHSQIFNDKIAIELRDDYTTLSEHMRDLGYATVNLMGSGDGIYNGVTRGYDRLIISAYHLHAYEGVERLCRYLDGLHDADHFVYLHCMDVHPWSIRSMQVSTPTQTHLSLSSRLTGTEEDVPSPYLKPTDLNQEAFWQGVASLDRALGTLFSYLDTHYAPEDYLISLYSDHGVPIFSKEHYIVDVQMTGAAWMMRGCGVPAGVLAHELTSIADLYPTFGHLLGFPVESYVDGILPKAFGGCGRDITYSNSLFPGRAYYLAARSASHTLCVSTEEFVSVDGRVDLAKAKALIYPRDHENEEGYAVDSEELRAFFYPRVRAFLKGIDSNGEYFPLPHPKEAPVQKS